MTWRGMVAVIVAERGLPAPPDCKDRAGRYAGGAAVGVPHSAQNFAAGLMLALQFVQCLLVGVPHSAQNLAPTVTGLWQLLHGIVGAAAGASAGGACGGTACGGAAGGAPAAAWAA